MAVIRNLLTLGLLVSVTASFGIVNGYYSSRHRQGRADIPGRYPARLFSFWVSGDIDGKKRGGHIVLSGVQVCPKLVLTSGHWYDRSIAAARYGGKLGLWGSELSRSVSLLNSLSNPLGAVGLDRLAQSYELQPEMEIPKGIRPHWVVLNGDGTSYPEWRIAGVALERYLQEYVNKADKNHVNIKDFPLKRARDYSNVSKIKAHPLYRGMGKSAESAASYADISGLFLSDKLAMNYWIYLPRFKYDGLRPAYISGLGNGKYFKTTRETVLYEYKKGRVWNRALRRWSYFKYPVYAEHLQRLQQSALPPGKREYSSLFQFDPPEWVNGKPIYKDGSLYFMRRFGMISKGKGWGYSAEFDTKHGKRRLVGGEYKRVYHRLAERDVEIPILSSSPAVAEVEPYPYPASGDSGGPLYTSRVDRNLGLVYTLYGTHSLQDKRKNRDDFPIRVLSSYTPLHDKQNRKLILSWMKDPASGCTEKHIRVAERGY